MVNVTFEIRDTERGGPNVETFVTDVSVDDFDPQYQSEGNYAQAGFVDSEVCSHVRAIVSEGNPTDHNLVISVRIDDTYLCCDEPLDKIEDLLWRLAD